MVSQTPWFDRNHIFNNPAGVFPCLYERFIGTPARLEEIVKNVPETILVKKPGNKWSVKENIGHLTEIEDLHETRLREYMAGKEVLTGVDITNKKTEGADYNQILIEKLLAEFRKRRLTFAARLENIDESLLSRSAIHPRLQKPMQLVDMVYFVCDHDDHHLAKMRAIINAK